MSSESEGSAMGSIPEVFERDTQFIPQENDAETLWEVIEITAERGKLYKVKWAGIDPKTKKPWKQSWVQKHDCTDDLVAEWKLKQAKKKKHEKRGAAKKKVATRKSHVSRASTISKASNGSSSMQWGTRSSTTIPTRDLDSDVAVSLHVTSTKAKRKISPSVRSASSDLPRITTLDLSTSPRPKKKRKIETKSVHPEVEPSLEQSSYEVIPKKKFGKVLPVDDSDDDDHPLTRAQAGRKIQRTRTNWPIDGGVEDDDQHTGIAEVDLSIPVKRLDKQLLGKRKFTAFTTEVAASHGRNGDKSMALPSKMPYSPPNKRGSLPSETSKYRGAFVSGRPLNKQRNPSGRFVSQVSKENRNREVSDSLGNTIKENVFPSPRLSPGAIARLEVFDALELTGDDERSQHFDADLSSNHPDLLSGDQRDLQTNVDNEATAQKLPLFFPGTPDIDATVDLVPLPPHEVNVAATLDSTSEAKPNPKPQKNGAASVFPPPPSNSFCTGVVPETQPEPSISDPQSQFQTKFQSNPFVLQKIIRNRDPPFTPRSSLVSKTKPKTPGSLQLSLASNSNVNSDGASSPHDTSVKRKQKALRPVPMISPSTFKPHLSLPDSTVEQYSEADRDLEGLVSSIEQFSSPENGQARRVRPKVRREHRKTASLGDSDHIRSRGQELADIAKLERQRKRQEDKGPMRTLDDVFKGQDKTKWKGKENGVGPPARGQGEDIEWSTSPSDHPPHDDAGHDLMIVQEMEDAYVDLSGGGEFAEAVKASQTENSERLLLRQEEEESTQDLLKEVEGGMDIEMEVGDSVEVNLPSAPESQPVESDTQHSDTAPAAEASSPIPDPAPDLQLEDPVDTDLESEPRLEQPSELPSESRSHSTSPVLRSKSVEKLDVSESGIPPTASTLPNSSQLQISPRSQTHPPSPTHHIGAAMALLNTKSEEISKLDHLLAAERAKNEALANEIKWVQSELTTASVGPHLKIQELERQLAEVREQWTQEKTVWDAERASHAASIDEVTRSKVSAEKDRDFFREQYAQASGYVTDVRAENAELEQKAEIAASQAKDGVALVRATFEHRVRALENDGKSWKQLARVLMEKDKRTGDAIRRRAGEEPGLRARCAELEEDVEDLGDEISALTNQNLQLQREKEQWEKDRELWRMETSRLNFRLSEMSSKLDKVTKGAMNNSGDDMVYRCQWRLGNNEACQGVFLNQEELRSHMYTGGHIHD